jgi:hypothetical protein
MTAERRKAIFFLGLTLIIGILIGSMLPGLFFRMRHNQWRDRGRNDHLKNERPVDRRREGFERMIYRVTRADSAQKLAIKPILDETSAKIDELQKQSNNGISAIMDSMKIKLRPLLKDDQMKSLEDFSQKARSRRRGGN